MPRKLLGRWRNFWNWDLEEEEEGASRWCWSMPKKSSSTVALDMFRRCLLNCLKEFGLEFEIWRNVGVGEVWIR